nr:MAG: hypothetical protein [Smacoviridae sp.]
MSFWDDATDWFGDAFDWIGKNVWDPILDVMGIDEDDRKQIIADNSGLPIIGDIWKAMDQHKQNADYMENRGIDWSDVKYPALVNTGSNYAYNVINRGTSFVSDNVKSLYDSDRRKRRK